MGDRENERDSKCVRGSDITQEAEIRGPSPLRRLAPLLQVPEIVWLAGGLPNAAMFPIKSLSAKLIDGTEIEMELGAEGVSEGCCRSGGQWSCSGAGSKGALPRRSLRN